MSDMKISELPLATEVGDADEIIINVDGTLVVTSRVTLATLAALPVAINAQTGTAYSFALADAGKVVTLTNANPVAVTLPPDSEVAWPVGTVLFAGQLGAGAVTLYAPGVTINGVEHGTATSAGQYAPFTLTKVGTDSWWLSGDVGEVTEGDGPGEPEPDFTFYRKTTSSTENTWASTPHDADNDLAGLDFEMRWHIRLAKTNPAGRIYIGGDRSGGGNLGWAVDVQTDRRLRGQFFSTESGTSPRLQNPNADTLPQALDGELVWLRWMRTGTTWSLGHSLDGSEWTEHGSFSNSESVLPAELGMALTASVGSNGALGALDATDSPLEVHRFQLWTGGDASTGTLRVDFDPSLAAPGTPANFTAATGEVWTFNGANYTVVHE